MDFAIGILTHNMVRHDRVDLFWRTLESLYGAAEGHAADVFIVSNGSNDGTAEMVEALGGTVVDDPVTSCGHGMNATLGICAAAGRDLVVFSNEDILWHPDAFGRLEAFWSAAPEDLILASGLLEDEFPWNTIVERVEYGGQVALVRLSAPGGAWTFRSKDWETIGPVPEAPTWDDVPACSRLIAKGYRVAQMDLADHIGQHNSTWGNPSAVYGTPLDREAWRIP